MSRVLSSFIAGLAVVMALTTASNTGETSESQIATPVDLAPFLKGVRREALRSGVSATTFDRAVSDLEADPEVLVLASAQPEFVKSVWD